MGVDGVPTAAGCGGSQTTTSRSHRLFPYLELAVALVAGGLWYLQGGALWYAGPWPGPLPFLLLVAVWAARFAILRPRVRLTIFDFALGAFIATAALGVWAAYDRGPAWAKFWLIMGAVGIYYGVAHLRTHRHIYIALTLFVLLGAAVALYFLGTNDWSAMAGKVPQLVTAGERLSSWLPAPPGHRMHPNVVAGLLVVMLPLCMPLIGLAGGGGDSGLSRPIQRLVGWIGIASLAVIGTGLVFSMSRGAWVAAVAASVVWGAWELAGRVVRRRNLVEGREWGARVTITVSFLVLAGTLAGAGAVLILAGRLPGLGIANSRLSLFRNSLLLAGDYVFTGAGLGMYLMQYSIYTMLIHAPHTVHSHNMLLDIAIEQGVVGLGAFSVMIGAIMVRALRGQRMAGSRPTIIIEAGMAGLVAMLVHGLVDDMYGARSVLLLLVPFGVVAAGAGLRDYEAAPSLPASGWHHWRPVVVALTAVLAVAIIVAWRPLVAAAQANLGALAQSRVELGAYDPDKVLTIPMDQVRRQENLDRAMRLLGRAVRLEPGNRTARQRLAAIALSRGEYRDALRHAEAAWDSGHRDDVTRLLMGDALVADGQAGRAAEVVQGLEWAERRLLGNAWYRYWVGEDYRRVATSMSTVLLLDPGNDAAAELLARAEAKLGK
jgi:hypothetical protein